MDHIENHISRARLVVGIHLSHVYFPMLIYSKLALLSHFISNINIGIGVKSQTKVYGAEYKS